LTNIFIGNVLLHKNASFAAFKKVAKNYAKFVGYFFIKKFCHQPQKTAQIAKSGHTGNFVNLIGSSTEFRIEL